MKLKYMGTSLFNAALRLLTSIALAGIGLYVSILWILRDIPILAVATETNFLNIFLDLIIPIILLGLSYGAARDSLLDFFDTIERRKRLKS